MSEQTMLAFLLRGDGDLCQVCIGCSETLHELGMLEVVGRSPLSVVNAPEAVRVLYKIAAPYTINDCRDAIKDRHTGRPWGS